MTEEKKKELAEPQQLAEAPASASVKIKSKNGFEYIFTMRDEKASNLMFKIDAMEKKWLELGWSALAQSSGFQRREPKPVEYVVGGVCQLDGGKLVYATKKDGVRFIKCENNKFINGQQTGCKYIQWTIAPVTPSQQAPADYPERQYQGEY